tara:strand:- start:417 stop:554 length:138 start_codon:yes stop_codon:yes gene_type:complete
MCGQRKRYLKSLLKDKMGDLSYIVNIMTEINPKKKLAKTVAKRFL